MEEQILDKIKSHIEELEKHRYTQKVIRTKDDGYPEISPGVREVYKSSSLNIGSRFNPEIIKVIEEIGEEKAHPLYLDSVSLLPGQRVELKICPGSGRIYYEISWDLPVGKSEINHREFEHLYDENGNPDPKLVKIEY